MRNATYEIIGETHLGHILDRIESAVHNPSEQTYTHLAQSCENLKVLLDYIREEKPKYLFREGKGPSVPSMHGGRAVRSLIEKVAKSVDTEIIYLDTKFNDTDLESLVDDDQFQSEREKEWTRLITQKDNGLISIGGWHTPRLKKRIERKNWNPFGGKDYSVEVVFGPDQITVDALNHSHIEILSQIYDAAIYKNRAEIENLKYFIDNFSVDNPMKLIKGRRIDGKYRTASR
jgi:hypothetical protein